MLLHVLEAVTSPLVAHVMLLHVLEGATSGDVTAYPFEYMK